MTKIEITDAMVQRAVKAGYRWQGPGGYIVGDDAAAHVRMVLDAALNPPPEPEIEVTKEMSRVGAEAYNAYVAAYRPNLLVSDMAFVGGVAAAYQAMRATRTEACCRSRRRNGFYLSWSRAYAQTRRRHIPQFLLPPPRW